jgi:hypothetical protein
MSSYSYRDLPLFVFLLALLDKLVSQSPLVFTRAYLVFRTALYSVPRTSAALRPNRSFVFLIPRRRQTYFAPFGSGLVY